VVAYEGLPSSNRAFEEPTGKKSWSEIFNSMLGSWNRDYTNYKDMFTGKPPSSVKMPDPQKVLSAKS
jgi:hypothetical protein